MFRFIWDMLLSARPTSVYPSQEDRTASVEIQTQDQTGDWKTVERVQNNDQIINQAFQIHAGNARKMRAVQHGSLLDIR